MKSEAKLISVKKSYSDSAIRILESLLKQAKEGEVVGFVMMYQYDDGSFDHCWTPSNKTLERIAHLDLLKDSLKKRIAPEVD